MSPRVLLMLAVSISAIAPLPAAASAAPAAVPSGTAARTARLEQLARELVDAGAPGVIVRVDDGHGHPIEITAQAPWTRQDGTLEATDEFREASSTKTMMATLVLRLVAEGRLSLDDTVARWLPGRVPNGGAITLRMLLNHTSGLYDYTNDPAIQPSIDGRDPRRWTNTELLAVAVKHPVLFAPGTQWSYSNTNYVAIGAVLERATGESVAELVQDRIARPLHLEHTYYATDSTWLGPYAHGYEPDAAHMPPGFPAGFTSYAGPRHDGHVDVSGISPSWAGAAGSMVSNPQDWSRFLRALMSGRLLPAAQLAELRTTVPEDPTQPDGPRYGLGIGTLAGTCGTFWGHDGGISGYLSTNATDGTGSRTMTILATTDSWSELPVDPDPQRTAAFDALGTAALCAMFDKPVPASS